MKRARPPLSVASRYCAPVSALGKRSTRRAAHLFALQHHEVKVPYPVGGVLLHALHERLVLHDLADVFVDECLAAGRVSKGSRARDSVLHSRGQVLGSAQAKALLLCQHDLDVGILRALEPEARTKRQRLRDALRSAECSPLVLTVPLAVALRLEALDLRQAIDAAGFFAARNARRVDA